MSQYYKHYKRLYKKYSRIINQNSKFIINWNAIIHKKKSLIESEGRCGGGETRSPMFVRYRSFEKNWDAISFYIDKYITEENLNHCNSPINVAILMEPVHHNNFNFSENLNGISDRFDLILTHNYDILKKYPRKSIYCIAGAPVIESSSIGLNLKNKKNLISTCYSNKKDMEGHIFRHKVVDFLKNIDDIPKIDLYGSGSPNGAIKLKSDSLINHMFSIVVENGVCDAYFTEKIMDCFLTGNIPIYRGTSEIGDFFDKRGILEFNTLEELEFILKNKVNYDMYKEMLPYAKRNLEITKQYMYIDDIMLFLTLDFLEKREGSLDRWIK